MASCSCKKKKGKVSGVSGVDVGELAQMVLINTGVRVASKAAINPLLAQVFKSQIEAKTAWVKYVPGAVKLALGYYAYDQINDERVKFAAVQVMSEGLDETLTAYKPEIFDPVNGSIYSRNAFAALRGIDDNEEWHMSEGVSGQDDDDYFEEYVSGQDDVLYLEQDSVSGFEDMAIHGFEDMAIHGNNLTTLKTFF